MSTAMTDLAEVYAKYAAAYEWDALKEAEREQAFLTALWDELSDEALQLTDALSAQAVDPLVCNRDDTPSSQCPSSECDD